MQLSPLLAAVRRLDESGAPDAGLILCLAAQDHLDPRTCAHQVTFVRRCPHDAALSEPFDQRRGELVPEVQTVGILPSPPESFDRVRHERHLRAVRNARVSIGPTTGAFFTFALTRLLAARQRAPGIFESRRGRDSRSRPLSLGVVPAREPFSPRAKPNPTARAGQNSVPVAGKGARAPSSTEITLSFAPIISAVSGKRRPISLSPS